ncbi:hypothetical protein BDW60DRAFT_220054 [Aspergillus nidulans var. acristatus]
MASQASDTNSNPSVGSNGQDPAANAPATTPQGPSTRPGAGRQGGQEPAAVPPPDLPRNAGQLTPKQKRDIIKKIVEHDGQGLPDIVPQGFKLTIGEVKAICDDPESRNLLDNEGNWDMDWPPYCDLASSRFTQYRLWSLKDNDLWEPGLGAEVTQWKRAKDLNSKEKEMLLKIAYIEIEHETDLQGVLPPNFRLKPSEILDILYQSNWPGDEEAAKLAGTKIEAAIRGSIIKENQLLESSRDEDDDGDYMELSKEAFRTIFRAVSRADGLTAMSEAIETNLPPGRTLPFQELLEMTNPIKWTHDYDKKLALETRTNINRHVQPAYRQDNYIFQHRAKPNTPPTLHDYHKQVHYGMKSLIQVIVDAIKSDGRAYTENTNAVTAAAAIEAYNREIQKYNKANNLATDTGVVPYMDLAQMWFAYEDAKKNNEVETARTIEKNMALFCEKYALPKWHPHEKAPKPKPKRKPKNPESGLSDSQTETRNDAEVGSSVELWGSKAIAYVPSQRTEPWEYRPGYTPRGEKIEYRQRMGASGVNFVVRGQQGWRLTPSESAGGRLARLSAEDANIPWALNAQDASDYLQKRLWPKAGRSYKYNVWFVAIGQLDLERKIRVPNMIVGFVSTIDGDPMTEEKVAIPRTALDRFIGKDTADVLVSRHITPLGAMPLRQALAIGYQKAGADSTKLRPLTQGAKASREQKLIEGLRNLSIDAPEEFDKLTGTLGLVRVDRRLGWKD